MTTSPIIYLNAAGLGSPDRRVHERIAAHAALEAAVGSPAAAAEAADELAAVRGKVARLIGAAPETVALASNTTQAWQALVGALDLKGRRILLAPHEWGPFVRRLGPIAEAAEARVETLPALDLAAPDLAPWADRIDDDVAAIFLPAVTSVAGLRYPIEDIGRLPRPARTKLLIDAAQMVGQAPLDVDAVGCDALFSTTRKWVRGPRQTAFAWIAADWRSPAFGDKPLAQALDMGDRQAAVWLGLGVALDQLIEDSVERAASRLAEGADRFRAALSEVGAEVLVSGPASTAIVSIGVPARAKPVIVERFAALGVVAKWPDPGADQPLSDDHDDVDHILRLSPHRDTAPADLDRVVAAIGAGLNA